MTRSVAERLTLIDTAERLNSSRNYHALIKLISRQSQDQLSGEQTLALLLATAFHFTGRDDEALHLAKQVEFRCERIGDYRLLLRCRNLLGSLYVERGLLHEAEAEFHSVLASSGEYGDQKLAAAATYNLGVIDTVRCHWSKAVAAYERASIEFYSAGLEIWLGVSRQNVAMVYRQLGRYEEADAQFERALEFAKEVGREEDLAVAEIERALLQSLMGDGALAEKYANRGLWRARVLGNKVIEGEALRVLGTIANHSGDTAAAATHLSAALEIARATSRRLLQAEVLEEIGLMSRKMGNLESADSVIRRAQDIYRSMGAQAHVERLGTIL